MSLLSLQKYDLPQAQWVQFRCGTDNIGALLYDPATGFCAAIDAPEYEPIMQALNLMGWKLTHILITHAHPDHVKAIAALHAQFSPHILAGKRTAQNCLELGLPNVNTCMQEGETFNIGHLKGLAWETPGHRFDHVSYVFESAEVVFCGDVLFKMGCGRAEKGQMPALFSSIQKLSTLPDHVKMSCGHDYMEANVRFALSLEPQNLDLQALLVHTQKEVQNGTLTLCSTLGEEKRLNPFVRTSQTLIKTALNIPSHSTSEDTFIALRTLKDHQRVPARP
jgi:hydroxyacylglutathione hydrolase